MGGALKTLATVVTMSVWVTAFPAAAFIDFSDGSIKVKHGIDNATLDRLAGMINALPEAARREAILGLQQALPEIEKSVDKAIERMGVEIDRAISNLGCVAQGTVFQVTESISSILPDVWQSQCEQSDPKTASGSTLVRDARVDLCDTRGAMRVSNAPSSLSDAYLDYLVRSEYRRCAAAHSEPKRRIYEFQAEAISYAKMWDSLSRICADTIDCYTKRLSSLKLIVSNANPRDTAAARASERLTQATLPDGWLANWKRNFRDYEKSLYVMAAIEEDIQYSSNARKKANDKLHQAMTTKTSAENDVKYAEGEIPKLGATPMSDINEINKKAKSILNYLSAANQKTVDADIQAQEALSFSIEAKQRVEDIMANSASVRKQIPILKAATEAARQKAIGLSLRRYYIR
ncbi:hypothetical protein FBZ83_108278 [Azospirillum brasilense]|uniref:Uncharacterized protein n=1 Tax=Azospirillum brasilense TaxID=192 RepID=A0A560C968_AZOBR|nr:hypothetical protein [Azospirillum brasilense]TWA81386.1 hypothetical protein FBZ83_108278 [Azospirillum brasilense]